MKPSIVLLVGVLLSPPAIASAQKESGDHKALLDSLARREDVWMCRRIDIANHWLQEHPFSAAGRS